MRSVRLASVVLFALGALIWPAIAGGAHGPDDDQLEMSHLGNSPKDDTTNSDIAFWGNLAYSGYSGGTVGGFRIIDFSDRSQPQVLVDYGCAGSQNDVGVWDTGTRRLLFVSVDGQRADDNCVPPAPDPPIPPLQPSGEAEFEGIRVFDVTDPTQPIYLKAVFTDCGSHTHTVVPVREIAPDQFVIDAATPDRVFIYVASYVLTGVSPTRCPDTDGDLTHNKISIVEVPFDAPEQADVLKEVPLHPQTLPFEPDPLSRGCHDIGVFLELKLAAAACQGEGQLWDISDPANPDTMGAKRIFNDNINYWHSASFTWDGKYLIFGDEEGGAVITHGCVNLDQQQPVGTGATWFYEVAALTSSPFLGPASGNFVQDREQFSGAGTICTAHNYNAIPVTDRYLLASAYYEAGSSVLDFTDVANADEVAYFDAAGDDTNPDGHENPAADTWSTYWYNGNVFANDINRGVDAFGLTGPAADLAAGAATFGHLNPQTQEALLVEPGDGGDGDGTPGARCESVIAGSKGPDRLKGTAESERIKGKQGRDRIRGGDGDDCLGGGAGKDQVAGEGGDDQLRGGRGKDRLRGGEGDDLIRAARGGRDRVNCGPGDDEALVQAGKDRARHCEDLKQR